MEQYAYIVKKICLKLNFMLFNIIWLIYKLAQLILLFDFNGMWTCQGLFYAEKLSNPAHLIDMYYNVNDFLNLPFTKSLRDPIPHINCKLGHCQFFA